MVVALIVGLTACDPPFPTEDPFYRPPSPLPAGSPGDIISTRGVPLRDLLAQDPATDVTSHQVMYRSVDALGNPMAVTGSVIVPKRAWTGPGTRPLVAYAVGTRGVGDMCPPSYTLTQGADYEGPIIRSLLDQGWAVAVTDYEGLGTPGLHTYMVGPSQGHAVLDVARAALKLPEAGLPANTPIGLMGYSQGGGAAGWAAELAGSYAPELVIKGSVLGGVPGDLAATADLLDGTFFVAFALMAAMGLDAAYPELDLDAFLNERGRALIAKSQEMCLVDVAGFVNLIDVSFSRIEDYVTTNPLDTPAWQARLNETELGRAAPSAPVFQYHGAVDQIVPFKQAAELRRTWCNKGTRVTWSVLPAEHVLGLVQGPPLGIPWLKARFAGVPTLGTCLLP